MKRAALVILVCLLPAFTVSAQGIYLNLPDRCGYDQAVLTAAIEQAGWTMEDLIQLRWSPNCHYLALRLPARSGDPGLNIVWDAVQNVQVSTLPSFTPGRTFSYSWDPSGDYLVVPANQVGTYLWHVPTNHQILLNEFSCGLAEATWDYDHNRLYATAPINLGNWCSPFIHIGDLRVYDLTTGTLLAHFPIEGYTLSYEFAANGRYLVLSGYGYSDIPVQIWDLSSGQQVAAVPVDEGGGIVHTQEQIELSPSGHYLVIGVRYLRIWETAPGAADQPPVYRYPGPTEYIHAVRFIDEHTIETTTFSGTQRWNLLTGEQLP